MPCAFKAHLDPDNCGNTFLHRRLLVFHKQNNSHVYLEGRVACYQ